MSRPPGLVETAPREDGGPDEQTVVRDGRVHVRKRCSHCRRLFELIYTEAAYRRAQADPRESGRLFSSVCLECAFLEYGKEVENA